MRKMPGWVILGMVLWAAWAGARSPRAGRFQGPTNFPFICTACKAEWATDAAGAKALFGGLPVYNARVVCPKCGQKQAFLAAVCPYCHKSYVAEFYQAGGHGNPGSDLCPHCGKDILKWRRKP